jgi:hypothetical protein
MREEGKGFSGICACTISVPDVVQSMDGCSPRGITSFSSPNVSRNLPSASIFSGIFGSNPAAAGVVGLFGALFSALVHRGNNKQINTPIRAILLVVGAIKKVFCGNRFIVVGFLTQAAPAGVFAPNHRDYFAERLIA